MKIFKNIFNIIIAAAFIFIVVRVFSGAEDLWLCKNGEWIKHGSPSIDKPQEKCLTEIKFASSTVNVEVSQTKEAMGLGLSGRENLSIDSGMLFVFEKSGNYSFWMKNMNFSLDILWINENFEIVGIKNDLSPSSYPKLYGETYFAKYVLELSAGYCNKNNIKVGDKIILN